MSYQNRKLDKAVASLDAVKVLDALSALSTKELKLVAKSPFYRAKVQELALELANSRKN
jgi:hypothetical protein